MTLSAVFWSKKKKKKKRERKSNLKKKRSDFFYIFLILTRTDGRVPGSFHAAAEACLSLRSYKARPLSVINFFILGLIFIHRAEKKASGLQVRVAGLRPGPPPPPGAKLETAAKIETINKIGYIIGNQGGVFLLYIFTCYVLYTFCRVFQIDDDHYTKDDKELSC